LNSILYLGLNFSAKPIASKPTSIEKSLYSISTDSGKIRLDLPNTNKYGETYQTIKAISNNCNDIVARSALNNDFEMVRNNDVRKFTKGAEMFLIRDNDDVVYSTGTPNVTSEFSPAQALCGPEAEQFIKKYFGLPDNARIANRGAFLTSNVALSGDQVEQEKVVSYALEYEQVINDLPISTLHGGNSIFVSVGNNGVDYAHMKWNDFAVTDQYNKIIPEAEAMQLIANALTTQDAYTGLYSSKQQIEMSTKLVYSNAFSAYSSDYIPVWETTIDDGRIILVNAVTGEIMDLCNK
jgi:hypothetical protein